MEKQSNKEELQLMIMPERPTKSAQMLNIYGENPNEKKKWNKNKLGIVLMSHEGMLHICQLTVGGRAE